MIISIITESAAAIYGRCIFCHSSRITVTSVLSLSRLDLTSNMQQLRLEVHKSLFEKKFSD